VKRFIGLAAAAAGGYWLATKVDGSKRSRLAPEGPGPVRASNEAPASPGPGNHPVPDSVGLQHEQGPEHRPEVPEAGKRWEPRGVDERHPLAMLYQEHRSLLSSVAAVRATDPEKPHDAKELHAEVQRIITESSKHEVAEETHLWPLVRSRLPDGESLASQACDEELDMKRILRALDTRKPGDIDFDELLSSFEAGLKHHVDFEESRVWPLLDASLTDREAAVLADELTLSEASAPTRPHPSELADPAKHPVLSKAAGLVDRGVDAIAGRGRGPYSGQ
jgi:hemerythrin-like domain-containing protein